MKTLSMPHYEPTGMGIPSQVVYLISINLSSPTDLLNFALINKSCYNNVMNNNDLWIYYLKQIAFWRDEAHHHKQSGKPHRRKASLSSLNGAIIDDEITPLNCLLYPISDPNSAKVTFTKIYLTLAPIITDLLVKNYSNFQNLNVFKEFNNSYDQSLLFSNICQFLPLFKSRHDYKSLIIRLNTILDIFISSIIKELEINLNEKNYLECYRLILSLNNLSIDKFSLNEINIDPVEQLLEFFITRYVDDYVFLTSDDIIIDLFERVPNSKERGTVRGFKFRFDKVEELFNVKVTELINDQLHEINQIFKNSANKSIKRISKFQSIDEIPIILKISETFLSSYLIGGLVDKLITRAKEIDQGEYVVIDEVEKVAEVLEDLDIDQKEKELDKLDFDDEDIWGEELDKRKNGEEEEQQQQQNDDDNENGDGQNHETQEIKPAEGVSEEAQREQEQEEEIEKDEKDKFKEINLMNENSLFFQTVPFLNFMLINTFSSLDYPKTMISVGNGDIRSEDSSMDYVRITRELIHFYYEPYLLEFSEILPRQCHYSLLQLIKNWEEHQHKIQKGREQNILDLVVPDNEENKSKKNPFALEIFSGFSNIFTTKKKTKKDASLEATNVTLKEEESNPKLTKFSAKLQILADHVQTIKSLVSMDLTISILQHVKNSYDLLLGLTDLSTKELSQKIYSTCEKIFVDTLDIIIKKHIEPGFQEALARLKNYNPVEYNSSNLRSDVTLEPLQNFIELVNIGDLILQMVNIFYQQELISSGIIVVKSQNRRDFFSANKCDKTINSLEAMLDTYVADGLDISIDVIINEINYAVATLGVDESTYDLDQIENLGSANKYVREIIMILDTHFKLLNVSIDKSILDVFKEEIGERFVVGILIKLITKRLVISTVGALQFISDMNSFYDFFVKCKIKPTVEYFKSLKKISQLYLIDCSDKQGSKELGKLVVVIGRDNGIFTPEEVYQFVSRRKDWLSIKSQVDKLMYGFGVDDCVIV